MKLCKDCVHLSTALEREARSDQPAFTVFRCLMAKAGINPVTGWDYMPHEAHVARANREMCGPDAIWFHPRPLRNGREEIA